jgi:hypothetical protein
MDALLALLERRSERERTRRLAFGLGIAFVASLTAWGALAWRAHALERAELCQGGQRRLVGIWDDAARRRVRDALLATRQPYAPDVWNNVSATLDRYAGRWSAMHKDSCEATRLRGEQTDTVMTLRMACLDRKLQDLSALVDVLGQADVAMLEKAGPAAAGLKSLEQCADVPALTAEVPAPSDPGLRARVVAVRGDLSLVEALHLAGRVQASSEAAHKAVEAARQTGYEPILAEALAAEGFEQMFIDPVWAAKQLTEAFFAAFASRLDRVAVAAANHAIIVLVRPLRPRLRAWRRGGPARRRLARRAHWRAPLRPRRLAYHQLSTERAVGAGQQRAGVRGVATTRSAARAAGATGRDAAPGPGARAHGLCR